MGPSEVMSEFTISVTRIHKGDFYFYIK